MKISIALKSYLAAKSWIAKDATDEVAQQEVFKRLASGELDAAKVAELNAEGGASARKAVADAVAEANAPILAAFETLTKSLTSLVRAGGESDEKAKKEKEEADRVEREKAAAEAQRAAFADAVQKQVALEFEKVGFNPAGAGDSGHSPRAFFGSVGKAAMVKGRDAKATKACDLYDGSKSAQHWDEKCKNPGLRGKRLTAPGTGSPGFGRPIDSASEADLAVAAAFFKWSVNSSNHDKTPQSLKMTDHDWKLLQDALHDYTWSGTVGQDASGLDTDSGGYGLDNVKLTEVTRKALLDDSTSGGITLVPQVFDDMIIQSPLLYGELWPNVTVENITRGRRIEAPTMGRPTLTSGIAEGTAIPLFDTTGFIGALDTVIQNVVGAMEIGNDFQEDSSVPNLGRQIMAAYGEALLQWLDMVIAVGDGTTQPTGIFTSSGTVAVLSVNGPGGPVAVGDLEGAMFGIDKAFRKSRGGRNSFIANETTYKRIMGIPTGTDFNTRAMGFDAYADYMIFGTPFRISNDVPNNKMAYVNLAWYKMYRRLGAQFKVTEDGKTLRLANTSLVSMRARYGGKLQLGSAAAVLSDLEA